MIDQYIVYTNNLKTNNVEFGNVSRHEEDILNFMYDHAINIIKTDSGERHLEIALGAEKQFDNIKTDTKYPSGLYIKRNKYNIEIFEKQIKEPIIIYNISKSVVWDYKFTKKPLIKYITDNDKFPTSNLYGFIVYNINNKYKVIIKDTFKGTIYNYDDVKTMYEFNCEGFYMSKPNIFSQYNNGDIIYYINHEDESFIIELVKGVVNVTRVEQSVEFNLIHIIGYNKITIDLPFISTNTNNKNIISNKANKIAKINKSDHGAVFNQLSDMFKKYDIDNHTEQFKPSMLKKNNTENKPKINIIEKIVEKIVEKDIMDVVKYGNIRMSKLIKIYFEYIHDIEHNMIVSDDNPSINTYINSLNDIPELNLQEIIKIYKLLDERLTKIIIEKNIDLDDMESNNNTKNNVNCEKNKTNNIIKKKFKKPTKYTQDNDNININDELFGIYLNNKNIINEFLIKYNYDISPLENIYNMNKCDINYWSRVLNFALKNTEINKLTIQEISKLYTKCKKSFDKYFMENNIKLIDNFQELLDWGELSYDDILYTTDVFIKSLKHVTIVNNVIETKDITEKMDI